MAYVKFVTILGMCDSEGTGNVSRGIELLSDAGADEAIAGRCYCDPLCQLSRISDDVICTLYMIDGRQRPLSGDEVCYHMLEHGLPVRSAAT